MQIFWYSGFLVLHSSLVTYHSSMIMPTLQVKVVPGARSNRVVGRYGDGIKIQVSAPPEDGKANAAVLRLLASALGLKLDQVQLLRGQGNPRKTVGISGMDEAALQAWIQSLS